MIKQEKRMNMIFPLLVLLIFSMPASADWQRGIDGAGTDLTGGNLVVDQRYRDAYFHIVNPSIVDSSWLTIASGTRVRIHMNTNSLGATPDTVGRVQIKILTHNRSNVVPGLNDAITLLGTMSSATETIWDVDGPAKILVSPTVSPTGSAYISVISSNPPVGD
jgi:hypothetical protein